MTRPTGLGEYTDTELQVELAARKVNPVSFNNASIDVKPTMKPEQIADELMALISQKITEAYKQGYIAGGIDTLTNEEVISE